MRLCSSASNSSPIFTSNLDEFFMIRVGSLCDMAAVDKEHTDSKSGLTAKEAAASDLQGG